MTHIRIYHRPSYTTPSFISPTNGVTFHSSIVKVRGCWDCLNYSCTCHISLLKCSISFSETWSVLELVDTLNNRVYVKHSYSKGDESQLERWTARRMRHWRAQGRKKDKKRSSHDRFSFYQALPLDICRNVLLYVKYREERHEQWLLRRATNIKKTATVNRKKVAPAFVCPAHTDAHYEIKTQ